MSVLWVWRLSVAFFIPFKHKIIHVMRGRCSYRRKYLLKPILSTKVVTTYIWCELWCKLWCTLWSSPWWEHFFTFHTLLLLDKLSSPIDYVTPLKPRASQRLMGSGECTCLVWKLESTLWYQKARPSLTFQHAIRHVHTWNSNIWKAEAGKEW